MDGRMTYQHRKQQRMFQQRWLTYTIVINEASMRFVARHVQVELQDNVQNSAGKHQSTHAQVDKSAIGRDRS
jgi:hypothetical protein